MVTNKELYKKTNLKAHLDLINTLFITNKNKNFDFNFLNINDKEYSIAKNDNKVSIYCSDGRTLNIELKILEHQGISYFNPLSIILLKYPFQDYQINLMTRLNRREKAFDEKGSEKLSIEEYLDESFFSIQKKDEEHKLIIKELKDGKIYKAFDCFDDTGKVEPKIVFMGGNGIFYEGIRMNNEGTEITEFKGKKVPNYDILRSFDSESEIEKINKVIESNNFSPITIDLLYDLKNKVIDKKKNIDNLFELTEMYSKLVSNVKDLSDHFIFGMENYSFSKEELEIINRYINMNLIKENSNKKVLKISEAKNERK